jgi:hypothetical protein
LSSTGNIGARAIQSNDLRCETERRGSVLRLQFSGVGDMLAVSRLDAEMAWVRRQLPTLTLVEIDIARLYLLNSSCLKAMSGLVLGALPHREGCRIVFVTDPQLGWQRRALAVLERLGRGMVSFR